jgi:hypothetical protein
METSLIIAFGLYCSVIAFVYAVSEKFENILSEETNLLVADRISKVSLSALAQNWYANAAYVLDWIFQFRQKGRFHIASMRRIFLWALFFILVLFGYAELTRQLNLVPTTQQLYQGTNCPSLGCWVGIAKSILLSLLSPRVIHEGLFLHGWSSATVAFPVAIVTTSLVDFVNISKVRTLIDWTYGWSARLIGLTAVLDLIFTLLISICLSILISYLLTILANLLYPIISSLYYIARYGRVLNQDDIELYEFYGYLPGLVFMSAVLSFVTSVFVVSIYVLTAALIVGMRLFHKLDNAKSVLFPYLNNSRVTSSLLFF